MSPRRILALGFALALIVPLSSAHAVVFKIATLLPDGSPYMQAMRQGVEEIAQRTDGRVTFRFYPGGTMGNDQSVLRRIRNGQLHGGAITGGGLSSIYSDSQIYNLPLLFRNYEEVDYVRERVDSLLIQGLEQRGYISFGLAETGFAFVMSNNAVRGAADLRRQKVWVPEGDVISQTIFETANLSPVPLPLTDVLTGLQTGLIDTVAVPPIGAVTLQWFTKVRYLTDTPLIYAYGTLIVSKRAFDRISAEDQAVVREVLGRILTELNRQTRRDNQSAREALRNQGIEFVSPTPEDADRWREIAAEATRRLGEMGIYTAGLLEILQGHLNEYRRNPGAHDGEQ